MHMSVVWIPYHNDQWSLISKINNMLSNTNNKCIIHDDMFVMINLKSKHNCAAEIIKTVLLSNKIDHLIYCNNIAAIK